MNWDKTKKWIFAVSPKDWFGKNLSSEMDVVGI